MKIKISPNKLRYLVEQGYSTDEIAELMKVPVSSVNNQRRSLGRNYEQTKWKR